MKLAVKQLAIVAFLTDTHYHYSDIMFMYQNIKNVCFKSKHTTYLSERDSIRFNIENFKFADLLLKHALNLIYFFEKRSNNNKIIERT